MSFSTKYPINWYPNNIGDSTSQAFGKLIKEIANIYSVINNVALNQGDPNGAKVGLLDFIDYLFPDIAPLQSYTFDLNLLSPVFLRKSISCMNFIISGTGTNIYRAEILEVTNSNTEIVVYATAILDYPISDGIPFSIERTQADSILKVKIYNQSSTDTLTNVSVKIVAMGV